MKQTKNLSWEVVLMDDLPEGLLSKAVKFLGTFRPEGMDPIWSNEHFKWKLHRNPAGNGFISCAVVGHEVVGVVSITCKRIWYKNREIIAGEVGDGYSHPNYRRIPMKKGSGSSLPEGSIWSSGYFQESIFGRLVCENTIRAIDRGINIIYGTPNRNSRTGFEKRLYYKSHPMQINCLARPTALNIFSFPKLEPLFKFLPLKTTFVKVCCSVDRLLESINYKRWESKRKKTGYVFEKTDKATADFDELWDKLKHQNEFMLVRDRKYFDHRFFCNPLADYELYKVKHGGELCGIIVSRIYYLEKGGKVCCLADWFYDRSKENLLPVMISYVIHDQYDKKVLTFNTWQGENSVDIKSIRKLGFFTTLKTPVIFYLSKEGTELIESCPSLDFTIATSDNI